ncbi:hypothetical protein Bbelb_054300 [Branchiostoma belcheri]|nr:hypothetical protein Bbelb_054300 [Branchiostoma belcheri]
MDDEGLFKMKGCEDHQEGDEWGTSDHDNCNCQGPYRFCYHVDCLSGSEIARDSKGLWDCPGGFSADDTVAENNKNDVDMSMLEKSLLQILQGRSQRTRYSYRGVLPHTKLGPIVLIIHVNKLPDIICSPSWAFVDDLNLVESRLVSEPSRIQNDLDRLSGWTNDKNMRLNPGKCKTMQVCFSRNPPPPPTLNIDGHQLAVVSVAKCLGVTFQADLKWDAHVKETTKKGNQRLYLLCRLRQFNPPVEDLLTIYTCFVRPVLEYAAPLWHPGLTKAQRRKIENIQRRATKIILAKEFTNYKSALEMLQLQTLEDRRIALCRRFANNIQAFTLYRHWLPQTRGSVSGRMTRQHAKLDQLPARTERYNRKDAPEPKAVDNAETRAVADKNDLDLGRVADDGLVRNGGCEGHQPGEQWGSSDHDNCICGESDRICYPVVCLPGSQIKPDSNRLWTCEVDSSKRDITAAAAVDKQQVIERVEDLLSFFQKFAEEKENAAVPEMDDEGLFKMKGCEDHQEGDEWGTSDHDNCNCQGPYRFCYHVDCLSGSEIARDSKGLWDCPGGFSADDTVAENNKNDVDMSMLEKSLLQILQEDAPEPKTADNAETRAVADKNDLDLGRVADDGLVRNGGCKGHQCSQENSGAHLTTTTASVENQIASAILLSVFLVLRLNLTPTASGHRFDITATGAATAFGVFTGVVGLIGFALDRYESAQTTAQLNEIQDQIRKLDGKIDGLTRSVSDLQLGQQYLQQVILYGRDELRLRNVLDTLASIRARNGRVSARLQLRDPERPSSWEGPLEVTGGVSPVYTGGGGPTWRKRSARRLIRLLEVSGDVDPGNLRGEGSAWRGERTTAWRSLAHGVPHQLGQPALDENRRFTPAHATRKSPHTPGYVTRTSDLAPRVLPTGFSKNEAYSEARIFPYTRLITRCPGVSGGITDPHTPWLIFPALVGTGELSPRGLFGNRAGQTPRAQLLCSGNLGRRMRLKVAQVYGLIGGGYSAWATALRIKGRKHEIPSIVRTGKGKLSSVKQILQKYVDYGTCHGGYQRKNRKCYKAFGFLKAWHDASAYCRRQGSGGNLAMPKDRSQPDNGYWKDWLGRYKRNEDCALYYEANNDTWNDTWNDADCSLKRYFICERTPFGSDPDCVSHPTCRLRVPIKDEE